MNEAIARLEAKLRGFDVVTDGATPDEWLLWRKTEKGHDYRVATDPATAEGAWEWVRLLAKAFYVSVDGPFLGGSWACDIESKSDEFPEAEVNMLTADPVAAVAAAVEALAESEAAARTS